MIEVDGEKRQWKEGMTLASLLTELKDTQFCSVIRMNGRLISSPRFRETLIPDGSTIRLLPLVAGG